MSTKTLMVLVAIIALAAGGYYLMTGSKNGAAIPEAPTTQLPAAQPVTTTDTARGVAPATDSIDDFSAAIDADLQAATAAVGALDADVDASVSNVQTSGANSNLYDPNNL